LRNGDALVLEDQRLVEIVAAPEALTEIICARPEDLARMAWHLGNRHLPVEIWGKKLRIRRDPVIAEMLLGLGVRQVDIEAPFEPEGGAYSNLDYHHHNHDGHGH
jgi:urease accessory protein